MRRRQLLVLTRKITGKVKVRPSSAIDRRWHRHRIGAPHHRQRRLVEGRIARALFDIGREHVAHAVEREANLDLGGFLLPFLRIALVLVEMRDQLLLPGRARTPCALAGADHRRDGTLSFRHFLGTRRRGGFGGNRLGGRLRLHRRDLRIVLFRLFRLVLRHHPVGLFGLGRLVLRQVGFLHLRLLLGELGRSCGSIGVRTRRQVGHLTAHGGHFESDLDRRCAERVIGFLGLQMHNRQRRAADVKRERDHRGRNPEPPGWLLLVEAGQGFAGAACDAAPSGTPSSATSLILE